MEELIQAVINNALERNGTAAARGRQPPALGTAAARPPARFPQDFG